MRRQPACGLLKINRKNVKDQQMAMPYRIIVAGVAGPPGIIPPRAALMLDLDQVQ
jgi:hypothetical protein